MNLLITCHVFLGVFVVTLPLFIALNEQYYNIKLKSFVKFKRKIRGKN